MPYGNAFEGLEFCHFSKSSDIGRWLFNSHCCAQVLIFRDKKAQIMHKMIQIGQIIREIRWFSC